MEENPRLVDLAVHIADGTPIDWAAADSCATPAEASVLDYLRTLERIAQLHAAPAADEPPVPASWGPLTIIERVGRGTYGDVYRARDPKLDRPVALKLLRRRDKGGEALESAVIEEGRLMARIRHPNVVTVYGAERIDGRVGLWMEFVGTGRTVEDELRASGPFAVADVAAVGRDLAAALGAVHRAGLLHRDVKAQNAIRGDDGRVVLTDFGAGHQVADAENLDDQGLAGTPLYLAPEVLNGAPASVASDLYSLGVVLFHIATGSFPVRGRTVTEVRRAHQGPRQHVANERTDLPSSLAGVIDRLTDPDPQARFSSASQVEAALAQPGLRRRSIVISAAAAVIVVAAALAAVAWRAGSDAGLASAPLNWAPLNAGDWIVVADFDNRTGEEVFDGTITAAVKRELEYSDFVHIAQRTRVSDALQLMNRPLDTRLDRQTARDVSLRDGGVRAFVAGSVARTANGYEIVLNVVDPASGANAATLTDRAAGPAEVLAAVRRQTVTLRAALGEPETSIDRSRQELERAPIPRVKALHLYARARTALEGPLSVTVNPVAQLMPFERMLREAVEDDPTFAAAAIFLADANVRIEISRQRLPGPRVVEGERAADILRYSDQALQLVHTATPLERLFIAGYFRAMREGALDRGRRERVAESLAAWEALSALQPDDERVMTMLQNAYFFLGRQRDAVLTDLRVAEARPRNTGLNFGVALQLMREQNLDSARRYVLRAESALSPASPPDLAAQIRMFPAHVAWLHDDPRTTLKVLDEIASTAQRLPEAQRGEVRKRLWPLYAALGQLHRAERIVDGMHLGDSRDAAANLENEIIFASYLHEAGDAGRLREWVTRWRDPLPENLPPFLAARMTYSIETGHLDEAERDLKWFEVATRRAYGQVGPEPITLVYAGAIESARGRPRAAIALLRRALPLMRNHDATYWFTRLGNAAASAGGLSNIGQYAAPILARALDDTGQAREAIAVLEETGANRASVAIGSIGASFANPLNDWVHGRVQLARLYRKNHQVREAEAVEAHLRTLLAVADPDYPLLKELNTVKKECGAGRQTCPD